MTQSRVTIKDVAAAAGVSITTVSHVLTNASGKRIAAETRSRVHAAATNLGYAANPVARTLRTRRSQSVGLVGDEIATTPFAGKIILGAQDVVRTHDAVLLVTNTAYDAELEQREIRALLDRHVDGVLYAAMYHRVLSVPPVLRTGPLVVLNARTEDPDVSWVVPDEYTGGWDAADVLVQAGHRVVGMINNQEDIPASHLRETGFRARCAHGGINEGDISVVSCAPNPESAFEASMRLLSQADRPTGVFAFNDRMAMGVYRAAAVLGLRIPTDVSVVGFDNLEIIAEGLYPGLTSLTLPHYEMGAWAADQLYAQIDAPAGAPAPVRTAKLRCPVVHRASVTSPPR
ncbi:MAG TPA: LacI family DNA-binding transcriptional regulator [Cellulomonadaceae bacterium]|nr:LacI family DNA-binding transcriptional regulator [Cellulomonadaceae bacterium]